MRSIYPELRKLVSALAAKNLTGRWCDVHFRKPNLKGCAGLAARDGARGVIWVDPDRDDDAVLKTALHELCHIRMHWDTLMDVGAIERLGARHIKQMKSRVNSRKENEARALCSKWLDLANRFQPGGDFLQKLSAVSVHFVGGGK